MTTIYSFHISNFLDMFDNMYPNICLSQHCKFSDMLEQAAWGNHLLTYNITDDQLISRNSFPINV